MQVRKSKELIYFAIYQLMYRIPYEKISVKMICDKAGVSRMSFYRYYSTKEDIFINFSDERFAEFYENYIEGKEITPEIFTKEVISYFSQYQKQIKLINDAHLLYIFVPQFEKYTSYILSKSTNEIQKAYRENPLLVPYAAGGLANILSYWCKRDFKDSEEEIARRFKDVFVPSLKSTN